MEIVINTCYGGFELSPCAIKEIAKRKGKKCYFFTHSFKDKKYHQITLKQANKEFIFFTYSVSDPQNYNIDEPDEDGLYKTANKNCAKISLSNYDKDRTDKDLIDVIKKFGNKANGRYSNLKIINIPDNIKYYIHDYDGAESIHEKHKHWC